MEKTMLFISQPMTGLSNEQIVADREQAYIIIREYFKEVFDFKLINNLMFDEGRLKLEYLGDDIKFMAPAQLCFFIGDYETHRGCLVEEFVAKSYGIPCIYEKDLMSREDRLKVINRFRELINTTK